MQTLKQRIILAGLLSAALLVSGLLLGRHLIDSPRFFPVKTVSVAANYQYISKADIQKLTAPFVAKGFFGVNLVELRNALLQLPWAETVTLQRVWPARLVLKLKERHAVARINSDGLVDDKGVFFLPENWQQDKNLQVLPQLNGPEDKAALLLQQYHALQALVSPLQVSISQLILDSRASWSLVLNTNATLMLGRDDVLPRLSRFLSVYNKITLNQPPLKTVDLRYPNGLAVDRQ